MKTIGTQGRCSYVVMLVTQTYSWWTKKWTLRTSDCCRYGRTIRKRIFTLHLTSRQVLTKSCTQFLTRRYIAQLSQVIQDIQGHQVRLHAPGGLSRGRGLDYTTWANMFRRQRRQFYNRLRDRSFGVSAYERHRVSRFETGEFTSWSERICQTCEYVRYESFYIIIIILSLWQLALQSNKGLL